MTLEDVLERAEQLTFDERVALVERLARQLQLELAEETQQTPLSTWLRGILKTDQPVMTKAELRETLTLDRIRKHLH